MNFQATDIEEKSLSGFRLLASRHKYYSFKIPLLVPGVGPFSNANIFVQDQLIAETQTDLKYSTCPLLDPVLY
jgi:hypothetical protein